MDEGREFCEVTLRLPVLRAGDMGRIVEMWKALLTELGGNALELQGPCFLGSTARETAAFQMRVDLPATGVVDENTWKAAFTRLWEAMERSIPLQHDPDMAAQMEGVIRLWILELVNPPR